MTHDFRRRQDGLSGDLPGTSCDQRFPAAGFKEEISGRFEADTKPKIW